MDLTTSKPQKLPITIIEHVNHTSFGDDITYNFGENIHSNREPVDDIIQDDKELLDEVSEEAFTPISNNFQDAPALEVSYSTLPQQYTIGTLRPKEHTKKNHYKDTKTLKRIKRPAYSTIQGLF